MRACSRSILIANRGEIACRVIRTARRHGHRAPSPCTPRPTPSALHVRAGRRGRADRPGAGARELSARRPHPRGGAGRPAPRRSIPATASCPRTPSSPRPATRAGIVFIGPPAVGDPRDGLEVRGQGADGEGRRAAGARLPRRRPGRRRSSPSRRERIGYPVLIKASAGGGGKGMRVVDARRGLRGRARVVPARGASRASATTACCSRSTSLRPRHIEIQVFGDTHGNVRPPVRARLLGAAPAPEGARGSAGAGHDRRAARGDGRGRGRRGARRSATSAPARSSSSPTQDGSFYFMEMNTRLQVEHRSPR